MEKEVKMVSSSIERLISKVGNIVDTSVPISKDEKDNKVITTCNNQINQ